MIVDTEERMSRMSESTTTSSKGQIDEPALRLIRKEKPQPRPRPPGPSPSPGGIRAPGGDGAPGGMVCPGPGRSRRGVARMSEAEAVEETILETPAGKTFRKPSLLGGKSIHLTILEGPDTGQSFDITGIGTYTVGRKDCDVVLRDDKISRKHASIIIARAGHYAVSDLASRNGTFVNGIRLSRRNLQHNDLLRVGNTTMRFTVFDGPVPLDK
jgi:hypothetical protein